jgi:Ca2+-binding RTX toxin-like protein
MAAVLGSSSGADATHAPDSNVDAIAHGLSDFAGSMQGLASGNLDSLAAAVPFTDVTPTGAGGLNLDSLFSTLKTQLLSGAPSSLADLQAKLNDPDGNGDTANDGTLAGGTVDIGGTVAQVGSIYDVTLTLDIHRDNDATPINVDTTLVTVKGGTFHLDFDVDASLHLQYDPSQSVADERLYLVDSENPNISVGFDAGADFTASPFQINLGIAHVDVSGTADLGYDFTAGINDPDGDGHITRGEFASSAPEVLFTVGCSADPGPQLDLDLTSDISGLEAASATIDLNDSNACNGLDAPTVNLNELGDFKNMTPTDMLSSVAQLASLVQSVVNVGPAGFNLPFLRERVGEIAKLNEKLVKFFTDNGLSAQPPESGDDCAASDAVDDDSDGFVNDGCPVSGAAETGADCADAADDDSDTFVNDGCPAKTNNPLDLNLTEAALQNFDTIDEVIPAVESVLGLSPGALGLAYDPTSKQLTFHIASSASATKAGTVDFSNQLEQLGIVDVDSATATASIDASYALDFTAGLDLTRYAESGTQCSNATDDDSDGTVNDGCPANVDSEPTASQCNNATDDDGDGAVNDGCPTIGPSVLERVFLKTDGAEPEFKANFETDADLTLDARIGFLGLSVEDSNASGPITLIGKRASDSGDMLRVDLDGGSDNKLTGAEILDGLIDDDTSSTDLAPSDIFGNLGDIVNVAVPQFTLEAEGNVSGTPIVSGSITVEWADILSGLPVITPQGNFNDELLSFDFSHEDPLQLLSRIIDTLDTFVSEIAELTGNEAALDTPLPLIGKSFKDLVDQIEAIKAQLEAIIDDPSSTLQDFETQFENLLGAALGVPESAREGILEIEASTASPTQLTFRLGLGVCSAEDPADADRCDAIEPLSVPINLNMGGEAISSLVGLEGDGDVNVNYAAVADLNFRIKLPQVTPDDGDTTDADSFPDVTGSPGLFLLDSSGIDLDASLDIATELQAHLGPLTIGVGETTASPESGAECNATDAVDDDQDGFVNDGCPTQPVGTGVAESGAECDDAVDAEEDDPADTFVNDGCPAKANPAIGKVAASFQVANDLDGDSGTEGEVDLSDGTAVSDYFSDLVPSPFSIAPDTPVTCPAVTSPAGDLAACARLPIFVGSNIAGVIRFGATDLLDPGTWDFDVPSDLVDNIFAEALDWTVLLDGLDRLLETLEVTLEGASYGATIPGIGDALDAGADIVGKFRQLVDQAQAFVDSLEALSDPTQIETELESWLNDNLGSLLDGSSVAVTVLCDTGSGPAACTSSDPIQSVVDAQFVFSFGDTAAEAHPKFDIGFPGLRLRADEGTTLDASIDWSVTLGFGVSKADGFYVLSDPSGTGDPEISVDAGVDLPDNGSADPDLKGDLAFIRLAIEDTHDDDPDVELGLSANITGPDRITLSTLTSGVDPTGFEVSLDGGVNLDLHIDTTVDIPGFDQEEGLPSLGADFFLHWNFGAGVAIGTGSGLDTSLENDLDVGFDAVTIDLGSFVNDFLGPIVGEIQRYLKPIQPVIDLVSAPIPGIAQLAELVGETPPTMIDLFEAASGADLTFVKRVIALITFVNAIPTGSSLGPIDLGEFDLDGSLVADRALPSNQVGDFISSESLDSAVDDPQGVLGEFGGSFQTALDTATGDGEQGGFAFPAFQQPTQLFRLLLGQDVTLIEWRSGRLAAEFTFSQNFGPIMVGPIPLSIVVSFSAGIEGRFGIGYDTFGIRKAVEALTNDDTGDDDFFTVVGVLFYGVFLDDLDSSGRDVPEISLFAEGAVGVALDLVIVSAGVEGGIRATIDMNLHDGPPPASGIVDGKLRIDEILAKIGNPICLFDVSGKLDAFIRAFVKVGLGPFSKKFSFTIVKITLLDLKAITADLCDPNKPKLAHIVDQSGANDVLRINIGPYAGQREINEDEIKEKVTVRQLNAAGTKFSVTGFGLVQLFPETGVNDKPMRVFADGGSGNDTILMDHGPVGADDGDGTPTTAPVDFTVETDLCGGPADDKIVGGDGVDDIEGDGAEASGFTCSSAEASGDGGDELAGRDGDDDIDGQGGGDEIAGEDGTDDLNGGAGEDGITGGEGPDTVSGGADADILQGGPETNVNDGTTDDDIFGGGGADQIEGEAGEDDIFGGPDDDNLVGSRNDDMIFGQGGNDVINGVEGDDTIFGGTEDDDIFGDSGNDTISGGNDADDIIGGKDNGGSPGDTLNGGAGRDYMLGDEGSIDRPAGQANANAVDYLTSTFAGNDTMNGEAGDDVMYGQLGTDTMNGGSNDDDMYGGVGADVMNGNDDADDMFGDPGTDTMHGNAGEDVMRGGDDDDTMNGDENDDEMYGDAGIDTMYGDDGDDYMRGSTGDDVMEGNANDDEMYGDADEDEMYGNPGEDTMFGNADHDYMEGNSDHDTMSGGGADDDMIGGTSSAGAADTGDDMNGDEGTDVMAGDNATMVRNSPPAVTLLDVPFVGGPAPAAGTSGDDTMNGNLAEDRMYGQSGNDTMNGGDADDYMEGNSGKDTMHGDAGLDDMLGGSGHDEGGVGGATRLLSNVDDESVAGEGDQMFGDAAVDFMAGDNANITRPTGQRLIALYNVDFAGGPLSAAALAGNDTMRGGGAADVMYGQADNDSMFGDDADDYMEGNSGHDTMHGNADQDDMLGGSGKDNGGSGGALRELRNALDLGDDMFGDGEVDYLAGDNAKLTRGGTNLWDPSAAARQVVLYDVQLVGGAAVPTSVSGPDHVEGNDGNDVIFGQGNGAQSATAADPPDGVDNDRDGRESGASAEYDCADGSDNDGDGQVDSADPGCLAARDEDNPWSGDELHGGLGQDYMEGNHGSDWMLGEGDEDDAIGGGSANDGVIDANRTGTNLRDGHDVMEGGDEDDVVLGDNGLVARTLTASQWTRLNGFAFDVVVRNVAMSQTPEPAGAFGHDYLRGNAGVDDMYGQIGNDYLEGNEGEDAMVGDLGLITNNLLGDGLNDPSPLDQFIAPQQPFISDTIFETGTLYRPTLLYSFLAIAGVPENDILLGGDGKDSMHAGAGADFVNGNADEDHEFGGDGRDVMWGGPGHDHEWGGHGADFLDVKPRAITGFPPDPPSWFTYGEPDNFQDIDYIYGGWDQDAMQANEGDTGPTPGDRLMDWSGSYNAYYLCPGLFGDFIVTRSIAPGLIDFLQKLANGDGAVDTKTSGSSGFRETAIVFPSDVKLNSSPPHPDTPGHFTC